MGLVDDTAHVCVLCHLSQAERIKDGVFKARMARPSIAAGPGEVARLVFEPGARCSAPGELGRAPGPARSAGGIRAIRGVFLLVTFLCTSKEK
jgi:hypothetical protein